MRLWKVFLLLTCSILLFPPSAFSAKKVVVNDNNDIIQASFKNKTLTCHKNLRIHGKLKDIKNRTFFISAKKAYKKKRKRALAKGNKRKAKKLKKAFKKKRRACIDAINNEAIDPSEALEPYTGSFGPTEAKHLYRRAGFGGTANEISNAVDQGLSATLDNLFNIIATPALDAEFQDIIRYDDEETGQTEIGMWLINQGLMNHFIKSPNQLREKMAYFWHDRFAASMRVLGDETDFLLDYISILRSNGLGNLRDIAKLMTINGMMLEWLDGNTNVIGNVNENYAREFWELFVLGRDNYTENDINEAARCYTGWTWIWDEETEEVSVGFETENWDPGQKTIFENTAFQAVGTFDATKLIDITLDNNPAASRYMAKNLLEFFVYKDPETEIIEDLAAYIRQVNYEIGPVVRRILASKVFFSGNARKNGIKTPLEFSIGFLRALNINVNGWLSIEATSNQGLELLNPPSVKGWDDDSYWLNDQWMLNRLNFVHTAMDAVSWDDEEFDYSVFLPSPNASAAEFLDHALSNLDISINSALRNNILNYLETFINHEDQEESFNFEEADDWLIYQKVSGLYFILSHVNELHLR